MIMFCHFDKFDSLKMKRKATLRISIVETLNFIFGWCQTAYLLRKHYLKVFIFQFNSNDAT